MRQLLRLLGICLEQVGGLEHQVQRSAITDPHLLMGTQTVEDRQAGPQMCADLQFARSLPAIGVGRPFG